MMAKNKKFFIHPTSVVDKGTTLGAGCKIWHFSHILQNCKIGNNCIMGQNVSVGPDVIMGEGCKVQNNVSIYKGVTLEDDVFCGPSCVFTNVFTPRAFIERKDEFLPTLVKKGATIGANATIVCGVTIGQFALIGAGAVVTKNVLDYELFYGVPANRQGWVCECGEILRFIKNKAICQRCKFSYQLTKDRVRKIS
jgi:UDP-2-acetamido-3-amino-2,3-dideoxy-glucuronate N-acetyltransferase